MTTAIVALAWTIVIAGSSAAALLVVTTVRRLILFTLGFLVGLLDGGVSR